MAIPRGNDPGRRPPSYLGIEFPIRVLMFPLLPVQLITSTTGWSKRLL